MSTYTPIASITTTGTVNRIDFTNIPSTYTDLVIVLQADVDISNDIYYQFNDSGSTLYSYTVLYGTGSAAGSYRNTTNQDFGLFDYYAAPDTTAGSTNHIIQIMNYANTNVFKTTLNRANKASGGVDAIVNLWRSTAAVNKVSLFVGKQVQNFVAGTTANLYGIANASITNVAKATGGDTVVTDGTYWYHVFRSSGVFTPTQALSCDVLQIAGGGATIGWNSGGGGGGGVSYLASQSLTATNYTVTVGAGGSGGSGAAGGNSQWGNASQFGSLTAATRGGSGGSQGYDGGTGGSGGGAGQNSPAKIGGVGTQGSNGGNSVQYAGGGGGGYSSAGSNGSGTTTGGAGGAGTSAYSSWGLATGTGHNVSGTCYYAGGGGGGGQATGGAGSNGGGGAGAGGFPTTQLAGTAGIANTGGGAGGGSDYQTTAVTNANGGSGIVIVRYSAA